VNPNTVRRADRMVGIPLCAALTGVRRVASFFRRAPSYSESPRRILFIKMIEQGATVLAYPAIRRAVEMVGRENVYFWVFEENRPILDILDLIPPENVLAIRAGSKLTFLIDIFRQIGHIRRIGIDAVVDMEFFARAPAILAYLTGAKRRVGFHRFTSEAPYRGDLMTHRLQHNPHQHVSVVFHTLVQALLEDPRDEPLPKRPVPLLDPTPPPFVPAPSEIAEVQRILDTMSERHVGGPIVLLNPNASDLLPLRKWPTDRFAELGRRIHADWPHATVVITGAPSERDAAHRVVEQIGHQNTISLAGETTLRQLLVLYCIADVLVTNDSGPGHFAALTPIQSLVLFGPETPALYSPPGRNSHVIWANLACSPCVSVLNHRFSPCRNNVCMQAISVEQVYDRVSSILWGGHAAVRVASTNGHEPIRIATPNLQGSG
jgi:ADP-heptose:LPS heptosyltransferase